jgi:hypothetical protein
MKNKVKEETVLKTKKNTDTFKSKQYFIIRHKKTIISA